MEIAIKDNKRNWQIVKDNRRYLFPPKIRLAFKICILVYAVLVLINVLMRQFKLWMAFVLPIAIIVFEVQIYYFAKKTINLQKEIFKKEEISFDLVFLDPPYAKEEIVKNITDLEEAGLLSEDVMIVCETDKSVDLPEEISNFGIWKQKTYGISKVTVYIR